MLMPNDRNYETLPQRCVLEMQGKKYDAVFTEHHMISFGFDENNRQVKYETIKRRFRLDKPVVFTQIFVPVIFDGVELKCYQSDDGEVLFEV